MGTELVGDRLSRVTNQLGTNLGGPNVRGPFAFGTKCVRANYFLNTNSNFGGNFNASLTLVNNRCSLLHTT